MDTTKIIITIPVVKLEDCEETLQKSTELTYILTASLEGIMMTYILQIPL